ncbi:MAG: Ig-like domain-containing protein, partial [Ignavibacteriaceae bacterium]
MTNKFFLLFTITVLFIYSCASQVPPSGGPLDKTPPTIIKVIPENKSTLVPLHQRIEFEFSEGMTRKGSERAVFISPDPGDRVKLKWKGRRLRIEFSDSLKINRTYVITLGPDLNDAHNNSLTVSQTLAFY